jgi:hypothetical protein
MTDDRQLLRRYADDSSEAAFGELVARHVNLVYSARFKSSGLAVLILYSNGALHNDCH